MSELTPELHIKKSSSATDALRFAQEHGVKTINYIEPEDDDQQVLTTLDVQEYYQRFRDMRAESEAMDRELTDRIEKLLS